MSTRDLDFDVFEAICGVQGQTANDPRWAQGLCAAVSPSVLRSDDRDDSDRMAWVLEQVRDDVRCTRPFGHPGDHVAANIDGAVLDRWTGMWSARCH